MDASNARNAKFASIVGMSAMFLFSGFSKIKSRGAGTGSKPGFKRLIQLFSISESLATGIVLAAGVWEIISVAALWAGIYQSNLKQFKQSLLSLIAFTVLATFMFKLPWLVGETFRSKAIPLLANISLTCSFLFIYFSVDVEDI